LKQILWILIAVLLLEGTVSAAVDIPTELLQAAPEAAAVYTGSESNLMSYLQTIFGQALEKCRRGLTSGIRTALLIAVGTLVLGLVETAVPEEKQGAGRGVILVGALWITAVTAGDLTSHIGLGGETIGRLATLSKLLIPAMAAAVAATGAVSSAGTGQVAAVFFTDILVTAIEQLLLPAVHLYIGLSLAASVLDGNMLDTLAAFVHKSITWFLKLMLSGYTAFLAISGAVASVADQRAVQAAKTLVTATVPVVGSILSQAVETMLSGAGVLRGTLGAFGAIAVVGICLTPALHLLGQYFLYQGAALIGGCGGPTRLKKLLEMLSRAFSLVLAMTVSCAMMLLISIISALRVVIR